MTAVRVPNEKSCINCWAKIFRYGIGMLHEESAMLPEAIYPSTAEEHTIDLDEQKTLDRIRHYIVHPPVNSRVMTITPKICHELLKYNKDNRSPKPKKIVEYANYMMAKEWMLTGDTIKFSNKGLAP